MPYQVIPLTLIFSIHLMEPIMAKSTRRITIGILQRLDIISEPTRVIHVIVCRIIQATPLIVEPEIVATAIDLPIREEVSAKLFSAQRDLARTRAMLHEWPS